MPSSTCATSWKTFTSNATKNHKLLENIRTDPAKMALYGHPGFTEVSVKIEQDWRAFIAQAERVNQAKGYLKGRANLFALQLVDEYGPADLLRILITEFDVNTNLKDNKGTFMLETAVRRNVTENALVLVRGVGRNKFRSYELGYQINLPCLAIRFKTTCVYDQISRTYTTALECTVYQDSLHLVMPRDRVLLDLCESSMYCIHERLSDIVPLMAMPENVCRIIFRLMTLRL